MREAHDDAFVVGFCTGGRTRPPQLRSRELRPPVFASLSSVNRLEQSIDNGATRAASEARPPKAAGGAVAPASRGGPRLPQKPGNGDLNGGL